MYENGWEPYWELYDFTKQMSNCFGLNFPYGPQKAVLVIG